MKYSLKHKSIHFFKDISRSEIVLQAVVTGLLTGFFVLIFNFSINHLFGAVQEFSMKFPVGKRLLILPVITALGGLISGLLVFKFAPETKGSGIPYVKLALSRLGKGIRVRSLFVKLFAGIAGIGSGLSLGKEGPSVQIGAGVGALTSKLFKIRGTSQYNLITAGAASALGATFNTPLAGMVFAVEELTQKFSAQLLFPVMIAMAVSVSVMRFFAGDSPIFHIPKTGEAIMFTPENIVVYVILGVLCGILGVAFAKNIFFNLKIFNKMKPVPNWLKPAIAGLVIGCFGVFLPEILSTGAVIVDKCAGGFYSIAFIALIFVGKFLATGFCFGSGAAGGIFLPTLLLGSLTGGFVGLIAIKFGFDINLSSICVVGIGAFLAAVARSPITAVMMVFEMTGNYHSILPVIFTVALSDLIAEKLNHAPIYTTLILKQNAHTEYAEKLSEIKVKQACSPVPFIIPLDFSIENALNLMEQEDISILPVKSENASLAGVVTLSDIEDYKIRGNDMNLSVQNILNTEPLTIRQNDDLFKAAFLMHSNEADYMIVLSQNSKIVGILYHSDILACNK